MSREHFYTTSKIGPNRSMTPEGYLVCFDVPIARSGVMIYGPDETPIEAGEDGLVYISREAEDIFHPSAIASALGKAVTMAHPDVDVTAENWRELAHGITLNVRRGSGALDDLLLADLQITTQEAIEAINGGLVEVSMGYEADYTATGNGRGRQSNIIFNHTAFVEQGRCGKRCAIKDHNKPPIEEKTMAKSYVTKTTPVDRKKGLAKVMDLLFKAHKAKDSDEFEKVVSEAMLEEEGADLSGQEQEEDTHIHIHQDGDLGEELGRAEVEDEDPLLAHIEQNALEHAELSARLDALEAKLGQAAVADEANEEEEAETLDGGEELAEFLEEEAPAGTPAKDARKATDSRYLGESMKDTVAMAEVLVPGIKIPTYDSKSRPGTTAKKICGLRKRALDLAIGSPANRGVFKDLTRGKTLDTSRMTCSAVRTVFMAAAALKGQSNNSMGVRDSIAGLQVASKPKNPTTIEEINAANRAFYASNK